MPAKQLIWVPAKEMVTSILNITLKSVALEEIVLVGIRYVESKTTNIFQ